MSALLKLAFRNLLRNRRRTLITASAITFGMALMIWTNQLGYGMYQEMMRVGISTAAGHVVVQRDGYQADPDPLDVVAGADAVQASLQAAFPEATVLQRSRLQGLLMTSANTVGIGVMAVQPGPETAVTDWHQKLVEGEWLDDDDDRGILLGAQLKDRLEADIGDKVVLMGQGKDEVTSRLFRVRGVFRTGAAELDAFTAIVGLGAAQQFLEMPDAANQVSVHLRDIRATEAALLTARDRVGADGVEVLGWAEAMPEMVEFIRTDRGGNVVMMGILGIIVAIGVLNTILMSVMERMREFGVMLALGTPPSSLATVIMLEGLLLAVFSVGAGVLFGMVGTWPLVEYGLDYSEMMGGETMETAGVVIQTQIHSAWDPFGTTAYALGGLVLTTLSAVYPAWRASRLEPVAAMHHV